MLGGNEVLGHEAWNEQRQGGRDTLDLVGRQRAPAVIECGHPGEETWSAAAGALRTMLKVDDEGRGCRIALGGLPRRANGLGCAQRE